MTRPGEEARTTTEPPPILYRFGGFELDPIRETLRGPDGPVLLRDHALRVLKLLVERAPEVVGRDDILDEVWGHQALSESSIAQVIRDIRAALGDPARNPSMLATRYGRGYQFIGDLERVTADDLETDEPSPDRAPPEPSEPPARREPRRPLRLLLIALVIVAGLSAVQWYRGQPALPTADAVQTLTLRAVAPERGEPLSAAFVDYLAFVIGNTVGAERVEVADEDDEIDPASRLVDVSLAALEPDESPAGPDDRRQLEISVRGASLDDAEFRLRLDEAADLVQRGLDPILATLERDADGELRLQAGLVSQSSFAIETLLRGMTAQLAGDVRRAATLFEAALAEDPGFEYARYELAIALRRDGETERAIAILEPMAERMSGDFWQMRIHNALGISHWRLRRYDEALDALRRADAASQSPADRATALGNIGLLERNLGQLDQAEATLREAIRLADLAEIGRHQAASRNTLASVLVGLDRDEEALDYLEIAREKFYEIGDLRGYAAVLSRTARIRTALGERNEPEALLRLALGVREQIDDRAGSVDIRIRLADLERIRGNFEEARTLATTALEESRALEEDDLTIDGYRALAALALADRRFDQATLYGREALRLAELTGRDRDQRAVRHGLLAVELADEVATDRGTVDDPGPRIRQLIDDADAADDTVIRVRARILSARHFRAIRQFDDARRALDRAGEVLEAADVRLRREIDAERARLGLERGDLDDAAAAVERLERSDSAPHPILMLKARLQAERGDLTGAVETAALAEATVGDWWTAEDQALLDRWSEANRR